MSYEKKEYILQFFEGVHEEENRAELIEVYRKAEAFDRIKKQYKDCCYTNEVNGFAYIKEGDFRELCEGIFEDYESGESE